MNKHLKCVLKALFVIPVLLFAVFITCLQLVFIVIPLGLLSVAGCIDADLPNPYAEPILQWFHDLWLTY